MDSNQFDAKFTPYEEVKGEDYMNDNHTTHFRAILDDWKTG